MQINFVDTIDSTNLYLYTNANEGKITEDTAIAASMQTLGKGRRGRTFFSPGQTGVYLSLLLHPDATVAQSTLITTMMASAAARALELNGSPEIQIKWVNDLYVKGKKVGGILTECSPNIIDGRPEFVVVGIGVNLLPPEGGFPEDIKQRAGFVFEKSISLDEKETLRKKIAGDIVDCFMEYYRNFPSREHFEDYKKRLFIIGLDVMIVDGPKVKVAGIDEDFRLIVRFPDGSIENLDAGEVSLII